jgi:hypothetical protein
MANRGYKSAYDRQLLKSISPNPAGLKTMEFHNSPQVKEVGYYS